MRIPPLIARLMGDRRGAAAPIVALLAVLLAAAIGGATDLTGVSSTGAKLQDAADSAALATTLTVVNNASVPQGELEAKARELSKPVLKGLSNKAVTSTVKVVSNSPAKVTVTLAQDYTTVFGALLGMRTVRVTREATAEAGQGVELCLLLLSNASDALTVGGTADLKAVKCGVQVNSKSSNAIGGHGNASVNSLKTYVAGPTKSAPNFTPQPLFNQSAVADPFAAQMPWPATSTCTLNVGTLKKQTKTLSPGVICGGIDIGNGGVLKLNPGVYVLQTGSVSVKSGGVLEGGAGATLVLTDPLGTVTVQAGGSLILEGAKTGPWKNIALAVKPQPVELTSTLIGGGDFVLDGIVYMPSQKLNLTGGASIEKKESPRAFVANRLELSGNGQVFMRAQPGRMVKGAPVRLVQ